VDVAGQPLALGEAPAGPLGLGELAAGRLQLLDQLPALVALLDDAGDPEGEQAAEDHRDQAADDRPPVLRQRPAGRQHLPPDDRDVLVPGVDPALAALAVQPDPPLVPAQGRWDERRVRLGAPVGGSAGQPFG
jgi:hypothetical protein